MIFASLFGTMHACAFAERTFNVDASTLRHLETYYALPDHLYRAVLKRQVEFLAGRVCAQHAVHALTGVRPVLIPSRPDRSPAWPPGMIGSITHTSGYAAALVASEADYLGLGIDCEGILPPEKLSLEKHICVPGELEALQAGRPQWPRESLLTLIFSAKESLFKCLYPQVQAYFGFDAARVLSLCRRRQSFTIRLEHDLSGDLRSQALWTGAFQAQGNLLMTAIVSAAEESVHDAAHSDYL